MARKAKDGFGFEWIKENSIDLIPRYESGVLTLRALYYQLVSRGMTNSIQHYKRVVDALGKTRRTKDVEYTTFSDHDRTVLGSTAADPTDLNKKIFDAKTSIKSIMVSYNKNRWENQPKYVEVWLEKKALQGVLQKPCYEMDVLLAPCKGYPSLTFLFEAAHRFTRAIKRGQDPIILYFGDYDATGVDIPRKIGASLFEDFGIKVEVKQIALNKAQVLYWNLPVAPSKSTDSRTEAFKANGGLGQVELDAVEPKKLQRVCRYAIRQQFDKKLYEKLKIEEAFERGIFTSELEKFVKGL